jgi:hypothetical protein
MELSVATREGELLPETIDSFVTLPFTLSTLTFLLPPENAELASLLGHLTFTAFLISE